MAIESYHLITRWIEMCRVLEVAVQVGKTLPEWIVESAPDGVRVSRRRGYGSHDFVSVTPHDVNTNREPIIGAPIEVSLTMRVKRVRRQYDLSPEFHTQVILQGGVKRTVAVLDIGESQKAEVLRWMERVIAWATAYTSADIRWERISRVLLTRWNIVAKLTAAPLPYREEVFEGVRAKVRSGWGGNGIGGSIGVSFKIWHPEEQRPESILVGGINFHTVDPDGWNRWYTAYPPHDDLNRLTRLSPSEVLRLFRWLGEREREARERGR